WIGTGGFRRMFDKSDRTEH
ncbi:hypothetical protein A2U01_0105344, partial [Trifolium medium]|nr:hypothetical protein [Trifolium medium]